MPTVSSKQPSVLAFGVIEGPKRPISAPGNSPSDPSGMNTTKQKPGETPQHRTVSPKTWADLIVEGVGSFVDRVGWVVFQIIANPADALKRSTYKNPKLNSGLPPDPW